MRAFIVYRRKTGIDVSHYPWASTPYIDLSGCVDCVVLAQTHKEVAELLGLGEYYVEERLYKPPDQRWESDKSCTIQIPREVFTQATEDSEWWGDLVKFTQAFGDNEWLDLVKAGYGELLVFDKEPLHLYIRAGEDKVILQIDALTLIQPALVNA